MTSWSPLDSQNIRSQCSKWGRFSTRGSEGVPPIFKCDSMKMAPSVERGPGNSEQYTWCTCWNGHQTERTSRAYKSSMWAWTMLRNHTRAHYSSKFHLEPTDDLHRNNQSLKGAVVAVLCQNEAEVKFQMDIDHHICALFNVIRGRWWEMGLILHLPHSGRGWQQLLLLISETSVINGPKPDL